jgi:hypothetical protein
MITWEKLIVMSGAARARRCVPIWQLNNRETHPQDEESQ